MVANNGLGCSAILGFTDYTYAPCLHRRCSENYRVSLRQSLNGFISSANASSDSSSSSSSLFSSATFGIHLLILSNHSFFSSFSSPSLKVAPSVVMLYDERERKLEMISA